MQLMAKCNKFTSVLLVSIWLSRGAELCLQNGTAESQRHYILNSTNKQSPIRLTSYSWRSAMVTSAVAEILISEVLGYHAVIDPATKFSTEDGIAALAGCSSIDCEVKGARSDIVLDAWLTSALQFFEEFQQVNGQVAEDLGSMGYVGSDGLHVKGSVLEDAANDGLALEYYKSYNRTFHEPQKYFDTLWELPEEQLLKCNDSFNDVPLDSMISDRMKNYLDWTGDVDGVVEQNGKLSANCPAQALSKFWIAPACRQNYTKCIPAVMLGPGAMPSYMQWAVAYGLPLALTHARNFDDMIQLVRNRRVLYYWWEPDETFLDLKHARIILPLHSPAAWMKGDLRTASSNVKIAKLVSSHLRIAAPRVRMFVERLNLEAGQLLKLLEDSTFQASIDDRWPVLRQSACQWIKTTDIWMKWIPVATDCTPGFGLADAEGLPVMSVLEAVDCQICPAGRFSDPFLHDSLQTYRCQPCNPGYHQSRFGQGHCVPCDPGTYAAEAGEAVCLPCERGRFVNSSAATRCFSCGLEEVWTTSKVVQVGEQERWIEVEGAPSASFCRCVQGRYFSPEGQCEICPSGSSCQGSGELTLLPGFYSTQSDPGAVLECFGNSLRCPGGLPGTCANGRDSTSPACSSCLPGLQPNADAGECAQCTGGDYFALVTLALVVLLGTAILHIVMVLLDRTSGSYHGALLSAALCLNQLVTCAQLFTVLGQMQDINWEEPFRSFLQFFHVYELFLDSVKTISCVTRISPEATFLVRTLLVPLSFAIGPLIVHLGAIKTSLAPKTSSLMKTFGFLFLLFHISLCSAFVEPFRCNLHPNGSLTMQTAHDVFCTFSGTHLTLAVMSGFVCLLPIGFLVLCSWVLVALPRRVEAGNAAFVRAYSFLILRFRPGQEAFTVVFLLRNVFVVLTPIMNSSSGLFVMGNLLAFTVASVAYFRPWRAELATRVDIMVSSVLLSVLLLGALTVNDMRTHPLMVLCTACGVFIIFALIAVAFYSVFQHIDSKFRRKFAFFLSHQRSASAGLVRLLSMELKRSGSRFTTFIDSDNLTDLSQLFSYVSNDTQTFVLVASCEVLKRKWCMGELVMARLAEVETILLTLPDFGWPDDAFIQSYARIVPDIRDLAAYGLGLSEVQDTLRWLHTVKSHAIAPEFSRHSLAATVGKLTGITRVYAETKQQGDRSDYLILADPENMEAMATAEVLGHFLVGIIPERGLSARVLAVDGNVSRTDTRLLLLCTQTCFQSRHIARWLLQARVVPECQLLPVLADEAFHVPRRHGEGLSHSARVENIDDVAYAQIIKAVFLEVALPFIPSQSSEVDLAIRARQVALRLYGDLKRLRTKMLIVGNTPESEVPEVSEQPGAPNEGPPESPPEGSDAEASNVSFQMLNSGEIPDMQRDLQAASLEKSDFVTMVF